MATIGFEIGQYIQIIGRTSWFCIQGIGGGQGEENALRLNPWSSLYGKYH